VAVHTIFLEEPFVEKIVDTGVAFVGQTNLKVKVH